jgi:hypothetical protein
LAAVLPADACAGMSIVQKLSEYMIVSCRDLFITKFCLVSCSRKVQEILTKIPLSTFVTLPIVHPSKGNIVTMLEIGSIMFIIGS